MTAAPAASPHAELAEHGYLWRPWCIADTPGLADLLSVPGRRLCMWRSPLPPESAVQFNAIFLLGWQGEDGNGGEMFAAVGRPFAYTLEHDGEFADICIVMSYSDGSAAISGLVGPLTRAERLAATRAVVDVARREHDRSTVMLASVPDAHDLAARLHLPVKPLVRLDESWFDAFDQLAPGARPVSSVEGSIRARAAEVARRLEAL